MSRPTRLFGALSSVPTLREQNQLVVSNGLNLVADSASFAKIAILAVDHCTPLHAKGPLPYSIR